MFHFLLQVPTTREVLAALPNVFSALCLNQRGLDAFVKYKPFDKLFKVILFSHTLRLVHCSYFLCLLQISIFMKTAYFCGCSTLSV